MVCATYSFDIEYRKLLLYSEPIGPIYPSPWPLHENILCEIVNRLESIVYI